METKVPGSNVKTSQGEMKFHCVKEAWLFAEELRQDGLLPGISKHKDDKMWTVSWHDRGIGDNKVK